MSSKEEQRAAAQNKFDRTMAEATKIHKVATATADALLKETLATLEKMYNEAQEIAYAKHEEATKDDYAVVHRLRMEGLKLLQQDYVAIDKDTDLISTTNPWPPPPKLWERMIIGHTGEVTFLPEDYVSPISNRKQETVGIIPPFEVIPTAEECGLVPIPTAEYPWPDYMRPLGPSLQDTLDKLRESWGDDPKDFGPLLNSQPSTVKLLNSQKPVIPS